MCGVKRDPWKTLPVPIRAAVWISLLVSLCASCIGGWTSRTDSPLSLGLIIVAVLSTILFFAFLRRASMRLTRQRAGLCLVCGYDLRATLGCCPECGVIPKNPLEISN